MKLSVLSLVRTWLEPVHPSITYASADGTVDFGFGGTVINVPYHQFIWQSGGFCFLGVVATVPSDVTWILGGLSLNAPRNGGY
jgi:hypothetical protein